ncbi:glycosyl hydrolase family 8 [Oceaniglobus roseus]|uniref:glycosyl hydrolase family 8 n=1 Tax=Oceaniglobus roseus TaxID=1737570 RepID=UPI000C7F4494|nr:glycosyl hydrolase family 8 [Kandeliimicrobium roseum]
MNRRSLMGGIAASGLAASLLPGLARAQQGTAALSGPRNPLAAPWSAWKAAFLDESGRVIDKLQQGASHSESQGYGLLMAATFGDAAAFDLIHDWTERNLAIRSDALLAWRWLPSGSGRVPDRNNAADGDLFYAWGLVIRAQREQRADLLDRASAIAADLVSTCVVAAPDGSGRMLLTPAAEGFDREGGQIINPSYYMPLAMREVARATGQSALATCATDGEALMAEIAAGGLVPDWVQIGPGGTGPAEGMSGRNGYEAVRVPLFLCWSGSASHPAVARQAQAYREAETGGGLSLGQYPIVMDTDTGKVIETSADVGYGAVAALVQCAESNRSGAPIPLYRTANQPYYPATLHLMTLIAQILSVPECVPI